MMDPGCGMIRAQRNHGAQFHQPRGQAIGAFRAPLAGHPHHHRHTAMGNFLRQGRGRRTMLQGNRSPIGLPQSECQRQFRFRAGLQLYPAALARACIKSLRSWLSVSPSMGKRSAPGLSSCFGWLPVCHRVHRRGAGVLPAGQTSTTVIPAAAACANAASAGSTHCGFSSVNPTCVLASSRPGHTCSPLASSTRFQRQRRWVHPLLQAQYAPFSTSTSPCQASPVMG